MIGVYLAPETPSAVIMVLFHSLVNHLARSKPMNKKRSYEKDTGNKAIEEMAKEAMKRGQLIVNSSRVVESSKSNNFASACSRRGRKGVNQDSLTVWEEFGCQEDMILCGIFDGHGPWGHFVARKVNELVPVSLLNAWQDILASTSLDLISGMDVECSIHSFDIWKQSFLKTYATIDQNLKHHSRIDSFRSGTTALTIVKQGQNLIMANIGDSRAILATISEDGTLVPLQLTTDLKPNLPEEAERIKQSKGRVFCLQDEPGVYRVWMPNRESPGLAISRAFGDYCVKDFGLISEPQVTHRKLSNKDQFLIMATDGVWDVLSNKEAVQIVSSASKDKAAKQLVECAARQWKFKKSGIAMDDMSAICLFFDTCPSDRSQTVVTDLLFKEA